MDDLANGCEVSISRWSLGGGSIYIEQPFRYMRRGKEKKMLRLNKPLYCLKQALRAWNERIDTYKKNGYK